MRWFQPNDDGSINLNALQLDIVGFLAILGEGSVLANAQVATLSRWIFLPRLIPAPQALMRPTRPVSLEPVAGTVTGIYSGNHRDYVNHIANIVCDANNLPPHSVRVVNITKVKNDKPLKSKSTGPLTIVLFIGFGLSVFLLGFSLWLDDGMSLVSTVLLSLLSSLIGLGNKWELELTKRKATPSKVPGGDVVIRYPKGSFLVVRCNEDVARELYFAPEAITYLLQHGPAYRILSLVGTVMLMGGVISLANARIESQVAWAGSYMLLGSSYWIVAALPGKMHWDTSAYEVTEECLSDSRMDKKGLPSESNTFTKALWKAIVVSKETGWVRISNACPDTTTWDDWLHMAKACSKDVRCIEEEEKSKEVKAIQLRKSTLVGMDTKIKVWEIPDWDPQKYFMELLEEKEKGHGQLAMET